MATRTEALKKRWMDPQYRIDMIKMLRNKVVSEESRIKISQSHKGKVSPRKGVTLTQETKDKIRNSKTGKKYVRSESAKISFRLKMSGENNPRWIKDRNAIKIGDRSLNDPLQKGWRKAVKDRDQWKCRISDEKCHGRLEAHHILPWSKFPELRYQINNGITLCHAHHPRKKEDVEKLSPYFQSLVAEM